MTKVNAMNSQNKLDIIYANMKEAEMELRLKLAKTGNKGLHCKRTLWDTMTEYKRWMKMYQKWEAAEEEFNRLLDSSLTTR